MTKLVRSPFSRGSLYPTAFTNDIFRDFEDFFNLDKFFGNLDMFDSTSRSMALRGFPRGDVFVEDGNLHLELALAGYSKDQLSVQVSKENGEVVVSAEKKEEGKSGRSLARRSFRKAFSVLPEWDLEKVDVSFMDGLLLLIIPPVPQVEPEPEPEPTYTQLEIK